MQRLKKKEFLITICTQKKFTKVNLGREGKERRKMKGEKKIIKGIRTGFR